VRAINGLGGVYNVVLFLYTRPGLLLFNPRVERGPPEVSHGLLADDTKENRRVTQLLTMPIDGRNPKANWEQDASKQLH
jgi:hypothetical protein